MHRKAHLCAGCGDLTDSGPPTRYARRALLRAAVFDNPVFDGHEHEFRADRPASAATVVTGVLAEVTEHAIVVRRPDGDQFLALSPSTVTWLGAKASPTALRAGDPVIIRRRMHQLASGGPRGRRAGRQLRRAYLGQDRPGLGHDRRRCTDRELLVDTGQHGREPERVVIAQASLRHVQVRFPPADARLPDRRDRHPPRRRLSACRHPRHRTAPLPRRPSARSAADGRVHRRSRSAARRSGTSRATSPTACSGSATPRSTRRPRARPTRAPPADQGQPCARLPYLSLGSAVRIRNECGDRAAVLPVTSCSASARQFCDRCVKCGTSPRARVADLTMAAFVELGGNLEDGCFNATLTLAAENRPARRRR